MYQIIIRILFKTQIWLGTAKSMIPRNVLQLKLRIFLFHPQIENYIKYLNYRQIKAYLQMNNKKSF
jgi:hypothetical protein